VNSQTIPCDIQFREQLQEEVETAQAAEANFKEQNPESIYFGLGGLNLKGMIWHFLDWQLKKARLRKDNLLKARYDLGGFEEYGTKIAVYIQAATDNKYYSGKMLIDYHLLRDYYAHSPTIESIPIELIDKLFADFQLYLFQKLTEGSS